MPNLGILNARMMIQEDFRDRMHGQKSKEIQRIEAGIASVLLEVFRENEITQSMTHKELPGEARRVLLQESKRVDAALARWMNKMNVDLDTVLDIRTQIIADSLDRIDQIGLCINPPEVEKRSA